MLLFSSASCGSLSFCFQIVFLLYMAALYVFCKKSVFVNKGYIVFVGYAYSIR